MLYFLVYRHQEDLTILNLIYLYKPICFNWTHFLNGILHFKFVTWCSCVSCVFKLFQVVFILFMMSLSFLKSTFK